MAEPRTLLEIMAYLAGAFPRQEFPEASQRVYVTELADLEPEQLWRAAREWVRGDGRFLPAISELRRLATRDPEQPPAAEAWAQLEAAYSPYRNSWAEISDNPITIRAAVSVFGSAGRFGPDAYIPRFDEWTRKAFVEAYDIFSGRQSRETQIGLPAAGPVGELIAGTAKRLSLPKREPGTDS